MAQSLWLCLRFPYLSMNSFAVRAGDSDALAITFQQTVYLVNQVAAENGVSIGQSIGQALMVYPALTLIEHDKRKTAQRLTALSHWAYRYTSHVHVHDEHSLLLEIGRSLSLFKGLKHLQHRISHDLQEQGLDVCHGLAHTPKAAHLLSFAEQTDWCIDNIDAQLAQARLTHLAVDEKSISQLQNCGFQRLGDILPISPKELGQRFGQPFMRYLDQLLGKLADPQILTLPAENFSSHIDFAEPISNRLWIEQQINRLLNSLLDFMQDRQLVCQQFTWRFYARNNRLLKSITIKLCSAKADFHTYRQLTELQLANAVMRWEFSSMELSSQSFVTRQAFHNDLFNPKPDQQSIEPFIEKLINRLGQEAVYKVSAEAEHLPERANLQQSVNKPVNKYKNSDYKDQPLWLLPQPRWFAQDKDLPTLLHGPHRISSHWWVQLHSRDYYIARQDSGRLLWIYHERSQRRWYLHGVFA